MNFSFTPLPLEGLRLTAASNEAPIVFSSAEYDRARVVLMHEPEEELNLGTCHPQAALFKRYFDADEARAEHRRYQQLLRGLGIEVRTLRNICLDGCIDSDQHWIEGPLTENLRELAASFLTFIPIGDWDIHELEAYKDELVHQYTPNDIMRLLLKQPDIRLMKTSFNTGVRAAYRMKPMMNLFYLRDQVITTPKGIVVCNMNSPQRGRECDLVEFCCRKLGMSPVYRIHGEEAFLEGGDYIPMRDFVWINCGLRTTQAAIDELMEHDLFGKPRVVVVKDAWKSQAQMHLDTYFNVIDVDLVTLCSNRYYAKPGDKHFLTVDVYERLPEGSYQICRIGQPLLDFLEEEHIDVIPISPDDEERMANNFLCIQGREIVLVGGQSEQLFRDLHSKGVVVHQVKLDQLICGYGAAHCLTQVVGRSVL